MSWEALTMRSRTSFFNGTIYRKDLTRFWPLWTVPSFFCLLIPLTVLLDYFNNGLEIDELYIRAGLFQAVEIFLPALSLVYAALCALAVWSYLDNARSVGLAHRLPIRREGLFITHFLAGMTMMLIPYLVVGLMTALVSALAGAFAPAVLGRTALCVLGESFFYFTTATLAAMITGNVFAMPVVYVGLHFLVPALDFLISILKSSYLFGVTSGYSGRLNFLSPTVYLYNHVEAVMTYQDIYDANGNFAEHMLKSVELYGGDVIGRYALAGIALLVLAFLLYRVRQSERAGDVVAFGPLKPVFRLGLGVLAALAGGQALYALLWSRIGDPEQVSSLPLFIMMVFSGLVGYFGADMLLEKSFRVFRKRRVPGAVLIVLFAAVLLTGFRMDFLHLETKVPETEQVKVIQMRLDGDEYTMDRKDTEAVQQVLDLHHAVTEDLDRIQQYLYGRVETVETENSTESVTLNLNYTLTGGQVLRRSYQLPLHTADLQKPESYFSQLDRFVNGREGRLRRLQLLSPVEMMAGNGNLSTEGRDGYENQEFFHRELTKNQAQQLWEAVGRDAEHGDWGLREWNRAENNGPWDATEKKGPAFVSMELWLVREGDSAENYIHLYFRPEMRETVRCLRELGLMKPDSLDLIPEPGEATEADGAAIQDLEETTAVSEATAN